jgi:Spy/CpxP family protein refolding chaperone
MIVTRRYLAVLALALACSAAHAAGNADSPGGPQQQGGPGAQGEQQRQEMFSKMKQIRVEGMQGRISILQTALSCVNAATSHEQMRPCEEQAHQAMQSLEQQQRAKMEALRSAGGQGARRGPPGPGGPNQGGKQQ